MSKPSAAIADARPVEAMRAFNRFYTRQLGLLDEHRLHSGFSLTEVRVLYEIAHGTDLAAADLARTLELDLGYMSRLLKRLVARGLLRKAASDTDARRNVLSLTAKGRKVFEPIEAATVAQVTALLQGIPGDGRHRVVRSMRAIQRLLGGVAASPSTVVVRDPRPGDIGHVIARHGALYAEEYGWNLAFEGLVAEIAGRFVQRHDPAFEHCWIAEREDEVVGSIFLVRKSARVAQLRLLYVEPAARGLGIGRRLVDECLAFARDKGYRKVTLWTNDVLVAARRIYQSVGFTMIDEERHHSFGKDLVGQHWTLDLGVVRRSRSPISSSRRRPGSKFVALQPNSNLDPGLRRGDKSFDG